jgi:hypothetical protein
MKFIAIVAAILSATLSVLAKPAAIPEAIEVRTAANEPTCGYVYELCESRQTKLCNKTPDGQCEIISEQTCMFSRPLSNEY